MSETNSVSAVIKNGELQNNKTDSGVKAKNGYDKDAFMQILVAQMKYQDPLEPTSNTEYISQYATFTQVEQLSNMASAMSMSRASELVGKTVTISEKNEDSGKTNEVTGVVDYVTYSGNKAYLNINGTPYDVDNVKEVLDTDYSDALDVVADFQKAIDDLPALEQISDEDNGDTIDAMYKFYTETMTDRARSLMDKNYATALLQYVNRIDTLRDDKLRTFEV